MASVLDLLNRVPLNRRKTSVKLVNRLVAYFGKVGNKSQAMDLVEELQKAGHIAMDAEGTITYLPGETVPEAMAELTLFVPAA